MISASPLAQGTSTSCRSRASTRNPSKWRAAAIWGARRASPSSGGSPPQRPVSTVPGTRTPPRKTRPNERKGCRHLDGCSRRRAWKQMDRHRRSSRLARRAGWSRHRSRSRDPAQFCAREASGVREFRRTRAGTAVESRSPPRRKSRKTDAHTRAPDGQASALRSDGSTFVLTGKSQPSAMRDLLEIATKKRGARVQLPLAVPLHEKTSSISEICLMALSTPPWRATNCANMQMINT